MNKIRVLSVDDNEELRLTMAQYLRQQQEIDVVGEASNGMDALKQVREKKADVMLLDMIMPALDGFGVLTQLQRLSADQRPYVIAVTALGRDDFIRRAIEVAWSRGRVDTLNKAFGCSVAQPDDKPTNGEFIALIADKLSMEYTA
jgi:two-component system response regulator (stage 0 sporulation protein A)